MEQMTQTPHKTLQRPEKKRTDASSDKQGETPKKVTAQVFTDFAAI